MARKHYNLPPLTTLAAFEAAARRLSFKDAAVELNVTPGAVSHQIKALEGELGIRLFERQHRGVALTDQGGLLLGVLEKSFSQISTMLARLRHAADQNIVTVSATTSVSALWLTPRLARFWKEHGNILVNQNLSDLPPQQGDFSDLKIRYGRLPDADSASFELFRDRLVPVCSPRFAERHPDPGLADLATLPLIHLEGNASWTSWATWFHQLGHRGEVAKGIHVNNYIIALQAAQEDAGVVLGWERLVRPVLERGELVMLGSHWLEAPEYFYIVSESDDLISDNARTLRNWLLDNI